MTQIIIDLDKALYNIRLIKNADDFANLRKDTKHHTYPPIEYPALYHGRYWDNPNGPDGILWEEIVSGDCIQMLDDFLEVL